MDEMEQCRYTDSSFLAKVRLGNFKNITHDQIISANEIRNLSFISNSKFQPV
jgi:hypothetical protein